MKKILIATKKPFAKDAIRLMDNEIDSSKFILEFLEDYSSKEELLDSVKDASAIIVRSDIVDKEVIETAKKLEIVVRAGAGYDNVDIVTAKANNVVVMNTPGQNSNAVAELAIGMAIMGARSFYSGLAGTELRKRVIGLHGYGYVARNVKRIARGLGMIPKVYTRYSKTEAISEGIEVTDSLEQLYAVSDVVSIHVPARGVHIGSVSYEVLKHLKEGAIIVNTARKEVINEDDLIRIFEERRDIKYLADIKPNCAEYMENNFGERVFFTPKKIGAQTREANINAGVAAAQQIVRFFEEGDTTFQINK